MNFLLDMLEHKKKKEQWYCRWAPSLGDLEDSAENVWGTKKYDPAKHANKPVIFFGLYGLNDFFTLWRHKGRKAILWAGSDILHFRKGYWLDDKGDIRVEIRPLIEWIDKNCENYVENEAEAWMLKYPCYPEDGPGIRSSIVPSFLGDTSKYPVSFKQGNKVYLSANEGRQLEYGFGIVESIAHLCPDIEFHLYGAKWETAQENVIVHGRIPKEKMNAEIRDMQCGLRLNKHDGFSEVTAKSVLWGQYPITYLYFPKIDQYTADNRGFTNTEKSLMNLVRLLNDIPYKRKPNLRARNYYLKNLNQYVWNKKI